MKLTYRNAYTTQFVLKTDGAEPVSTTVTFTTADIHNLIDEEITSQISTYAETVLQTLKSMIRDQTLVLNPFTPEDEEELFTNIAALIKTEWDKATGCYDPN